MAVWQTGIDGLNWIDDLVNEEKAIGLGGDGYPFEYTAQASHIIPHIRGEPPKAKAVWTIDPGDVVDPNKWHGKTTKDPATMDACRADEWLLIRAWDES